MISGAMSQNSNQTVVVNNQEVAKAGGTGVGAFCWPLSDGGGRGAMKPVMGWLRSLFLCSTLISSMVMPARAVEESDFRIVLSYDGLGDKDDIGAAAFAIAMIGEAGHQDKLMQVNYFDFRGQSAESKRELPVSVLGGLERWGMPREIAFNYQERKVEAIEHFQSIVADESRSGQIYIACGGPMRAIVEMVSAIPEDQRGRLTAVSHSRWNDWVKDPNWNDLAATGINTIQIYDQNKTAFSLGRGWQEQWKWLQDKGGRYQWLYERNKFGYKFDISDAGIAYYLVTGRGNQNPSISDVRAIFGMPATRKVPVAKVRTNGLHVIKGAKHVSVDEVRVGQSVELWHKTEPSLATDQRVNYSSGNAGVATVHPENGIITGVSPGTATIFIVSADGGKKDQIEVEVVAARERQE